MDTHRDEIPKEEAPREYEDTHAWEQFMTNISPPLLSPEAISFIPVPNSTATHSPLSNFNTSTRAGDIVDPQPTSVLINDQREEELVSPEVEEERFVWSVAHELIEQLNYRFPEAHPSSLLEVLKQVGMDVTKAASVLKNITEKENSGITQVCRHYLQGECRRADCMFLHDTNVVTCRFWLRGACTQIDQCIFLHGVSINDEDLSCESDSEDEVDDVPPDLASEDKFPALGTAATAAPILDSFSLDFAKAVNLKPAGVVPSSNTLHTKQAAFWRGVKQHTAHFGNKWVNTGDSVTVQYKKLRADASTLASARNACFVNATQCYRNGNKARATELSRQGREYNAKMKALHLLAATEIFKSRNPPNQLYRDQLMDLHGLHVAEAIEFLVEMLPQLAAEGLTTIRLVTGSGHHSLMGHHGKARLRPAVERYLNTEGYSYSEVPDQRGYVGMLLVHISW